MVFKVDESLTGYSYTSKTILLFVSFKILFMTENKMHSKLLATIP